MKHLIFTIIGFLSFTFSQGQHWQYGAIREVNSMMSQGIQNAFTVEITDANPERASEAWEQFARKFKAAKKKYDRKTHEYLIDDAVLPDISANTVDIYTIVKSGSGSSTIVLMWFDLGGAYINCHDHPDKGMLAKKIVENYAKQIIQEEAAFAVHSAEELLRTLKKEYSKLQNDQRQIQKKISNTETMLQELNKELTENQTQQIASMQALERQESMVEKAKAELKRLKD